MAVHCKIKMKDGYSVEISYVCFGFLRNMGGLSSYYFKETKKIKGGKEVPCSKEDFVAKHPSLQLRKIKHIDYLPLNNDDLMMDVYKNLYDNFPIWKDCISVHPRLKAIRVKLGTFEADKIVLGLMMARNLQRTYWFKSFMWALNKCQDFRVATLFSDWFCIQDPHPMQKDQKFYTNNDMESQITDPWTLGVNGVTAFLKQEPDYFPWKQESLVKTGFYIRDCDYEDDDEIFNDKAPEPEFDHYGDIDNYEELDASGNSLHRKMVSCFSDPYFLEGDSLIPDVHSHVINGAFCLKERRDSVFDEEEILIILNKLIEIRRG